MRTNSIVIIACLALILIANHIAIGVGAVYRKIDKELTVFFCSCHVRRNGRLSGCSIHHRNALRSVKYSAQLISDGGCQRIIAGHIHMDRTAAVAQCSLKILGNCNTLTVFGGRPYNVVTI
ncbi:hypothetical protein SDC9_155076 [bioreactor metagenome]|uniref:Uncharacterized protein n=1 Tax=bioreactor metagenome TaxID=1076179 RepID=A0A645F5C9_9ZZZZ